MKIVYYANFKGYLTSDATEQHISRALKELGHEVIEVQQGQPMPNGDWLLCHKPSDPMEIAGFQGKKVCWFFDKVWHQRIDWMKRMLTVADKIFLTDKTWTQQNPHPKFKILRQGIGYGKEGVKRSYKEKIVYLGSIYKGREDFIVFMFKNYSGNFSVRQNIFNQDLRDLCVSVPIIVAPNFPSDDYYWSSRVYMIIGSGGFLIHPYCKELTKEYEDGKEIVYYKDYEELKEKIGYYLAHPEERESIRLAGYLKTIENFSYKDRIKEILKYASLPSV